MSETPSPREPSGSGSSRALYHGGVPGLEVGDRITPAIARARTPIGMSLFTYQDGAHYDPAWIYCASEPDIARAYAARYMDVYGQRAPGDAYRVLVDGADEPDPDYTARGLFTHVYRRARSAKVVEVVDRAVQLTPQEQLKLEAPWLTWTTEDEPRYDSEGRFTLAPFMPHTDTYRAFLALLAPWSDASNFSDECLLVDVGREANGDKRGDLLLRHMPSLDTHGPVVKRQRFLRAARWECQECGQTFSKESPEAAARHQIGEEALGVLQEIYRSLGGGRHAPFASDLPLLLARAGCRRDPDRWEAFRQL